MVKRRLLKRIIGVGIIILLLTLVVCAFLFIPRKTNAALLPNTQAAIKAYPEMKIADKEFSFPIKGLKHCLDYSADRFGTDTAYEKKYRGLCNSGGLYVTLSYTECMELQFSMSDDLDFTLASWSMVSNSKDFKMNCSDNVLGYSAS